MLRLLSAAQRPSVSGSLWTVPTPPELLSEHHSRYSYAGSTPSAAGCRGDRAACERRGGSRKVTGKETLSHRCFPAPLRLLGRSAASSASPKRGQRFSPPSEGQGALSASGPPPSLNYAPPAPN